MKRVFLSVLLGLVFLPGVVLAEGDPAQSGVAA